MLNKCLQSSLQLPGNKRGENANTKISVLLSSAGKHGTLTSGFSSVISGDRAVAGAKQLQFCAGLSLHMHKGKSL